MPAALDVNKEEVRMLALSLGVREAARKMELNEKTVLHWSAEGKWFAHLKPKVLEHTLPLSMQPRSVASVKPADALQSVLAERKKNTKLHQTRYLERASKALNDTPDAELLSITDAALQLATMASKVYPEDHQEAQVSLQFFSISQEKPENWQEKSPERQIFDIPGSEVMDDPML